MIELSMVDKIRRTAFLGREFLTWLMFRSDRDEGVFRVNGEVVEVFFERAMTLEGQNPAREMATLKVETPTDSDEVMASLRLGKRVSKARLMVIAGGREFGVVVDHGLALRGVKLPDAQALDPIEVLAEEQGAHADLEAIVHGLFEQFLRIRIEETEWKAEASEIAAWIFGNRGERQA